MKYCSNGSRIEMLGESNFPDLEFLVSSFEQLLILSSRKVIMLFCTNIFLNTDTYQKNIS